MKPLLEYRQPAAAAEIARLDVPVLLVGMRGGVRAPAADYRTATNEGMPALPTVAEALLDGRVCVAPLSKSSRNPYQNFIFVGRASTCDVILRDASVFDLWPHIAALLGMTVVLVWLGARSVRKVAA